MIIDIIFFLIFAALDNRKGKSKIDDDTLNYPFFYNRYIKDRKRR